MNCLCSHDLVSCPCYFQLATKEPSSTDSFQSVFDMMLGNQFVFVYQAWTENLQPKSDHDDMRGSSSAGEDAAALFIQMECCPM